MSFEFCSELQGINVTEGEFVAVTADGNSTPVIDLLKRIREAFRMDVVFVSQFLDGRRVIRTVSADPGDAYSVPEGASDPLEESYCHWIAQGRLPEVIPNTTEVPLAMSLAGTHLARVGAHLATLITTKDGNVYGTLCCFNHSPMRDLNSKDEISALKAVASLLAEALDKVAIRHPENHSQWSSNPHNVMH